MTYLKKLIIIAIVITCISAGAYFVNALIGGGNNTTQISSLQKGLVGHWPLDKESLQSATTFADKTPYENVGTKYGSVLKFDGVDDYVNCGNDESLDITNAITISAWVNLATLSPTGSYPSIVKKYTPASSGYGMNYRRTENRFGMAVYDGTEHLVMTVADGCVVDTWYHVVGTWDGATMIMYVNGTTSGTPVAHDGSIVNDAGSLNVGTYGSSSQAFDGSIGDTRIYNRALSEAEILTLYEGGAVSETGLVAHYKFGDKAGATLTDETANNNDGTLTGFTSTAAGYGDTHDSGWNTNATPNVFAPDNMGQSGRAMSFDGASDYVNCGDDESLDITEAITISAWVKTDDKTSFKGILCKEDSGGVYNYLIYVMDSSFRFQSYNGRVLFSATTGAIISENTWYYVVGTFDESLGSLNGKIYLDGELKGQYTYTSPLPTNNANVSIGKYGTAEFNGSIADVRIYNRALEPEEITMLYEQYRPKLSVGSLQKGLVLDMPLKSKYTKGGAVGSEILTDRTPQSNDGANHGATVGADYTTFNGTSDYIDCGNDESLDITDAITISVWVKPVSSNGAFGILQKDKTGMNFGVYEFHISDGELRFILNSDVGSSYLQSSGTVLDNVWTHVVVTHDRSLGSANMKCFLDGVQDASTRNYTGAIQTSTDNLKIGKYHVLDIFFNGSIADVRIYDRALEPEEITMLYDKGR